MNKNSNPTTTQIITRSDLPLAANNILWSFISSFLLQVAAEYVSKIINTVINVAGIVAVLIGLAESQQLTFRDMEMRKMRLKILYPNKTE